MFTIIDNCQNIVTIISGCMLLLSCSAGLGMMIFAFAMNANKNKELIQELDDLKKQHREHFKQTKQEIYKAALMPKRGK